MKNKARGFSVLEVLISAGIFTIVILGISQTVLLMHRYARGNLCQMQAHLLATSYFEQLLCHTHPLELNGKTGAIVKVLGCGLCGSDIVKFIHKISKEGTVLGHEIVAEIVEINSNTKFKLSNRS